MVFIINILFRAAMLSTWIIFYPPASCKEVIATIWPVWMVLVVHNAILDNEVEDSEADNTNNEEDKNEKKRLYRSCVISDTW